jgi:hypothetical protein
MNFVSFILVLFAGVIGVVEVFTSAWKSLVGWALIALSVGIIVDLCTTWSHTIHT